MPRLEWGTVLWDGVDERGLPLRIVYAPEMRGGPYVTQAKPADVEPRWWFPRRERPWESLAQSRTWDKARRGVVKLADGHASPPIAEPGALGVLAGSGGTPHLTRRLRWRRGGGRLNAAWGTSAHRGDENKR